jgi:hypothetical protein
MQATTRVGTVVEGLLGDEQLLEEDSILATFLMQVASY